MKKAKLFTQFLKVTICVLPFFSCNKSNESAVQYAALSSPEGIVNSSKFVLLNIQPGSSLFIDISQLAKDTETEGGMKVGRLLRSAFQDTLGMLGRKIASSDGKPNADEIAIKIVQSAAPTEKDNMIIIHVERPQRATCQDFTGMPPYVAYVRKEENSAYFALCPRYFNLPTEDESINLENYSNLDKVPQKYVDEASHEYFEDPLLKRPKSELDSLLNAEMGRYKGMYKLSESRQEGLLRHEIGHLFGLCDQYTDGQATGYKARAFHDNCHVTVRSSVAKPSVMNGASDPKITVDQYSQDDILGIKVMGCLDTAVNAKWAELSKNWITADLKKEIRRLKTENVHLNSKVLAACEKAD